MFSAKADWIEGKNSLVRQPEEQLDHSSFHWFKINLLVVAFIVEREGGSGRLGVTIADLAFSTRISITADEETGIGAPVKNLLQVISINLRSSGVVEAKTNPACPDVLLKARQMLVAISR